MRFFERFYLIFPTSFSFTFRLVNNTLINRYFRKHTTSQTVLCPKGTVKAKKIDWPILSGLTQWIEIRYLVLNCFLVFREDWECIFTSFVWSTFVLINAFTKATWNCLNRRKEPERERRKQWRLIEMRIITVKRRNSENDKNVKENVYAFAVIVKLILISRSRPIHCAVSQRLFFDLVSCKIYARTVSALLFAWVARK